MRAPMRVFISYSHEDEAFRRQLEAAFSGLVNAGKVSFWHDRKIPPGAAWGAAIEDALEAADVIMLLVSNDFQNSDYITSVEVPRAMERRASGAAIVIPIIVRVTDWRHAPYSSLQALPDYAKPVTSWEDADEAWFAVVRHTASLLDHGDPPAEIFSASLPYVNLAPSPPSPFLGRDSHLQRVSSELSSSKRVVIIRGGLGGVGKSALAASVARKEQAKFRDGILWAQADMASTQEIMSMFLNNIGIPGDSSAGSLPVQYLSALGRRRCLIILDNASSAGQISPLVPRSGPSKVLVTSRYAISADLDNSIEVTLPPLPLADASRLLKTFASAKADDPSSAWIELARELGSLPLALRIAAGVIREMGWSAADYLMRLRQVPGLSWLDPSESGGLGACFSVSYQHLRGEQSRLVFRVLGAFTGSVSLTELEDVSGLDSIVLERALLGLARQGLAGVSKGSDIEVHPLVQRYAQELLQQEGEARRVHMRAAQGIRSRLSSWSDETQSFTSFGQASIEDGLLGLRAAKHFAQAGETDSAQEVCEGVADAITYGGNEIGLWSLLHDIRESGQLRPWLGIYWCTLALQMHHREWEEEARKSLLSITRTPDAKVSSAAWIALGKDAIQAGRLHEALTFFHSSLSLKQTLHPADDRGISYVLNELGGLALRISGDTTTALQFHNDALALQESLDDLRGMCHTLRKISYIYLHHKNDATRALETLDRAEQSAPAEVFPFLRVSILIDKADAFCRLEKFRSAAGVLASAIELSTSSDDPHCEAKVLRRSGILYERVQLYGASLKAFTDATEIYDSFDPRAAEACRRGRERVRSIIEKLRMEEEQLQRELVGPEPAKRASARRLKRVRQQMGTIPGMIRLGRD
jgi:tetratricopeptide (TPR) repeat protein